MIEINGKKFALTEAEFTDSLFSDKTCVGFYRPNKRSITLMDQNKNKVGILNHEGILLNARKLDTGKYWYTLADIDLIGSFESWQSLKRESLRLKEQFNIS